MENRIKELRTESGYTQIRLGIELEVSQETISGYESGNYRPGLDKLIIMAELFDTSVDYLIGRTNQKRPIDQSTMTPDEAEHLRLYRKLNAAGKRTANTVVQSLCQDLYSKRK